MRSSFPVSFTEVNPLNQELFVDTYNNLLSTPYTEQEGFGFREIQLYDNFITATLVKRTPTYIPQLDTSTGQLNEREIFLYSKSKFGIDFRYGLLEIYGTVQHGPKVRSLLRGILPSQSRVSSVTLMLADTIKRLSEHSHAILVDSLTVSNFRHKEGIIGKYMMRITKAELAESILQEYKNDVIKAHLQITSSSVGNFALELSRSGYLLIICDESIFVKVFSYLKSIIFSARSV